MDYIGVNVHMGYPIYSNNWSSLKTKLGALGMRHVRDGALLSVYPKAVDLYNTHGIKTLLLTGRRTGPWPGPLDTTQVGAELNEIKANCLSALSAIEGPNEYDLFHNSSELKLVHQA